MEIKIQMPFQQLLDIVRGLNASQKAILRKELEEKEANHKDKDDFIKFLLNGPVYTEEEIDVIKENTKSIAAWRTTTD